MSEEKQVFATVFLHGLSNRPVTAEWKPPKKLTRWQQLRRWLSNKLITLAYRIWDGD